jgi:ABC-2 type transport system permease protein
VTAAIEPYWEFAKKAFSREATYRFEVFSAAGSLLLRVYLLRSLWTALYAQNAAPLNLPLHAMITYATVSLLMSLILEIDGTRLIREKLREGTIATDLMKPIVVPFYFFSDGFGRTLLYVILVFPTLLVALLMVHVDVPSPQTLGVFLVSFVFAYCLNFLMNFCMNAVAFWTLETFALQLIVRWISDLLSGQIIPLTLFPGLIGSVLFALPFAAIYSTPLLIYVGIVRPQAWGGALAAQAVWIVALAAISFVMWRAASRRIILQGG